MEPGLGVLQHVEVHYDASRHQYECRDRDSGVLLLRVCANALKERGSVRQALAQLLAEIICVGCGGLCTDTICMPCKQAMLDDLAVVARASRA